MFDPFDGPDSLTHWAASHLPDLDPETHPDAARAIDPDPIDFRERFARLNRTSAIRAETPIDPERYP